MRVTDSKNDEHSTAPEDPRRRLRWRFFGSLVLMGLLVGLMIGRLTTSEPVQLLRVEPQPRGLQLVFDREPQLQSERLDGAVAMLFQAQGQPQQGQLTIDETRTNWRLQTTEKGLLLHFVATRPLMADSKGQEVDGRWRLEIVLKREAGKREDE